MKKLAFALAAFLAFPSFVFAQYWADYVLEKGFDGRSYFLQPHRIQSLQLRNLDSGLQWIRPDSLADWTVQPALLSGLSGLKIYLDLKGRTEERFVSPWHIYPVFGYQNASFLPPYMIRPADRELKPLLSLLWLGDVSRKLLPGLKYGISYEIIHHQGPYYEYVPFWYFGAVDAFGQPVKEARQFPELPINLKKTGLDQKTETAHRFNSTLAYRVLPWLSVGIGAGLTRMNLDGNYSRFRDYSEPQSDVPYISRYLTSRRTGAKIDQKEWRAGGLFLLPGHRILGAYGGQVFGVHRQTVGELDTSSYSWGEEMSQRFSRSLHRHTSQNFWKHTGHTSYAGLQGQLPLRQGVLFRFRAEHLRSAIDLSNGDADRDTSFSHYRWYDLTDSTVYESVYRSSFSDARSGSGGENRTKNVAGVGILIPLSSLGKVAARSRLTIGLYGEESRRNILVFEDAAVRRFSAQDKKTRWSEPFSRWGFEDKTVRFHRNIRLRRLALPVLLDLWLGENVVFHVGAVKEFRETRVDEVVDIWYRADSLVVVRPSGKTVKSKEPRIDRYEATPVRISATQTLFRGGISFLPSHILRIDLAMRGRWLDLDAWQLALTVNL